MKYYLQEEENHEKIMKWKVGWYSKLTSVPDVFAEISINTYAWAKEKPTFNLYIGEKKICSSESYDGSKLNLDFDELIKVLKEFKTLEKEYEKRVKKSLKEKGLKS